MTLTALAALLAVACFSSTAPAQDDFVERVDRAVERGRKHLEPRLRSLLASPPNDHKMGRIALPLTALLKAGTPVRSSLVAGAFTYLNDLPPNQTYDVACYLFALDIFWQRMERETRAARQEGTTFVADRSSRRAKGPVLKKMVELIEWLVNARVRGRGSWDYGVGRFRYDYSNSQFAILGLQVGIEHGIRIPSDVFLEIANEYMKTQITDGPAGEIRLTFNPPLDRAFTKTYAPRRIRFQGRPGGWNYRGNTDKPYAAMTAAGTSNLIVARSALEKLGALSSSLRRQLDSAIYTGMGWMAHRFGDYIRGAYYGLYSLEKVGDLGDVQRFGDHDWYREGAEELLRRQQKNGSWGNYVDTSFALLFLTRATRIHMRGVPPPTIYTVAGDEKGKSQIGDVVFVDDLEAFISAREFFYYLRETRNKALIPIAEQIVRNYALDRQPELIPHLVSLWGKRSDAITKFARTALAELTGAKENDPEFYTQWHAQYLEVVGLLEKDETDPEAVGKLLGSIEGVPLKHRLLDFIERENMVVAVAFLADELQVADDEYRRRVHDVLVRFTGENRPLDTSRRDAITSEAARWRQWWAANGERLAREHRLRRWIDLINRDPRSVGKKSTLPDRSRLLESLIAEGTAAVPFILEAMGAPSYRIELVLALERISGEQHGVLPDRWRAWWREELRR